MATMGIYCKAYPLSSFQSFGHWDLAPAAEEEIGNQDYLFLQENYVVTANVYIDENIVYNNITPEWIVFCKNTLHFEVPIDVLQADEAAANGMA